MRTLYFWRKGKERRTTLCFVGFNPRPLDLLYHWAKPLPRVEDLTLELNSRSQIIDEEPAASISWMTFWLISSGMMDLLNQQKLLFVLSGVHLVLSSCHDVSFGRRRRLFVTCQPRKEPYLGETSTTNSPKENLCPTGANTSSIFLSMYKLRAQT